MSGRSKPSCVGPIWALERPPEPKYDGSVHLTFIKNRGLDGRETITLDNEDIEQIADALGLQRTAGASAPVGPHRHRMPAK